MKRRIKSWSVAPRKARGGLQSSHLIVAGIVGAALLALLIWMLSPTPAPDQLVADAGPAEPPCAYLVRVDEREQRCDPATIEVNQAQVSVDLLMPAMPASCRPIVSDTRGRLYPLTFKASGQGLRGSIGPIPEQTETYRLRFVAWDERQTKEEACAEWASYSVAILRQPPPTDAGRSPDAGKTP